MNGGKKLNAEELLAKLAAIRAQIPHLDAPRPAREERPERMLPSGAEDMVDFEMESVAEALESMADELHGAIDAAQAKALSQALDVYYTAEELAKDPAHADLIPHLEAMRAAYEHDFGKPIPPRTPSKKG